MSNKQDEKLEKALDKAEFDTMSDHAKAALGEMPDKDNQKSSDTTPKT